MTPAKEGAWHRGSKPKQNGEGIWEGRVAWCGEAEPKLGKRTSGVKVIQCRVSAPGRGEEGSCVGEWPHVGWSPVGIKKVPSRRA